MLGDNIPDQRTCGVARVINLCCRCSLHGCPPRYVPSSSPSPSASSPCSVTLPAVHTRDHHPPRPRSAPQFPPFSVSTSSTHYTPSSSHAPQTSSHPSASHLMHHNLRSIPPCCCSICNNSHMMRRQQHQQQQQRTAVQLCQCS